MLAAKAVVRSAGAFSLPLQPRNLGFQRLDVGASPTASAPLRLQRLSLAPRQLLAQTRDFPIPLRQQLPQVLLCLGVQLEGGGDDVVWVGVGGASEATPRRRPDERRAPGTTNAVRAEAEVAGRAGSLPPPKLRALPGRPEPSMARSSSMLRR